MELLLHDTTLHLLLEIIILLWAIFKSTDLYRSIMAHRYGTALTALEAGVHEVAVTYVNAIKEGNADGKLTEQEKKIARDRAVDAAVRIGKAQGVNVVKLLGDDFLDYLVGLAVSDAKGAGIEVTAPQRTGTEKPQE